MCASLYPGSAASSEKEQREDQRGAAAQHRAQAGHLQEFPGGTQTD